MSLETNELGSRVCPGHFEGHVIDDLDVYYFLAGTVDNEIAVTEFNDEVMKTSYVFTRKYYCQQNGNIVDSYDVKVATNRKTHEIITAYVVGPRDQNLASQICGIARLKLGP
jgi:hypothetical protein